MFPDLHIFGTGFLWEFLIQITTGFKYIIQVIHTDSEKKQQQMYTLD